MKYLKKFITPSQYNTFLFNDIKLPNVSYIEDTDEVKYNPFSLLTDEELLDKAGTAIVFDTINQKLKPIDGMSYNTTDYPQDIYEPVGVVVMPASHTEDGYARMCSLKYMGVKTDDEGNVTYGAYDESNKESEKYHVPAFAVTHDFAESMNALESIIEYYNEQNINFGLDLKEHKKPYISYNEINGPDIYNVIYPEPGQATSFFYFTNINLESYFNREIDDDNDPIWMSYKNTEYGWNGSRLYTEMETNYRAFIGSPYNIDGSPNLKLRWGDLKTVHGNGISNMIYEYINNTTVNNRFDLFNASKLYYTAGTNQGEWYIPSLLELTYFSARAKEIYSTINKMNPYFFINDFYGRHTLYWPQYYTSNIFAKRSGTTTYLIVLSNILESSSAASPEMAFISISFNSVKLN